MANEAELAAVIDPTEIAIAVEPPWLSVESRVDLAVQEDEKLSKNKKNAKNSY